MKEICTLALEGAESLGSGIKIMEEELSKRIRRLSFAATSDAEGKTCVYHTLLFKEDPLSYQTAAKDLSDAVASSLSLLKSGKKRRVLAIGLGNASAVTDALGAQTVKKLSAGEKGAKYLATFTPSVSGLTGLETASVIRGVAKEYRPDLILTVDTLSTGKAERLCRAVQITDGGVVPGGGVGNKRAPVSSKAMGVPVLSVGVSLLARLMGCDPFPTGIVVAPKEIDLYVPLFASAIAAGVERGLF